MDEAEVTRGAAQDTEAWKQSPFAAAIPDILEALRGVRYGQVTVIVQDSVVVQIDRTERRRLV